jgi:predicted Zn finger-like uncharacterized protein
MRIVCPNCAAEYEVPPSRMAPRRVVRCARCGGEWMAVRDEEPISADEYQEIPAADSEPEPAVDDADPLPPLTAMDRLAVPVQSTRPPATLRLAWITSAVILIAAAAATFVWRGPIARAWPPAARILGPADSPAPQPPAAAVKSPEPTPPHTH